MLFRPTFGWQTRNVMDLPKAGILVFVLGIDISYPIVKGWEKKISY